MKYIIELNDGSCLQTSDTGLISDTLESIMFHYLIKNYMSNGNVDDTVKETAKNTARTLAFAINSWKNAQSQEDELQGPFFRIRTVMV